MLILIIATIVLALVVLGLMYALVVQNREFRRVLSLKEKRIKALTGQLSKSPKSSGSGIMEKLLRAATKAKKAEEEEDEWAELLMEE